MNINSTSEKNTVQSSGMDTIPYVRRFFKAFIRVVKSVNNSDFASLNQIVEPLIEAKDKIEVKEILLAKYPQFFQNGKIYEKETKDTAQFFYVIIFELYQSEINLINEGEWVCDFCGQKHENKYISKPVIFQNKNFCRDNEQIDYNSGSFCLQEFKDKILYANVDNLDNTYFVGRNPIYIYKITEKQTNKCYIGKTKNHAIWRWWSHLTKNSSPFGIYLKQTKLSDWTFEVLQELDVNTNDNEVFRIESEYIKEFNSIENGFNSVISNKSVYEPKEKQLGLLLSFDNA